MIDNVKYFNYSIDLDKYKLLRSINPEYLDCIVDDILTQGYNLWVKNFIKSDPSIIFNSNQNNRDNNLSTDCLNSITDSKLTSKGSSGENVVIDILKERFPDYQIENTSKIPHYGDIQVITSNKIKIMIEVKNYNKTIDQDQIDKLKFDMKFTNINLAIFISLNSGIVGKKRFEIESFYYGKTNYYIMYIPYSMHKSIPNRKYIITHNSIEDSVFNLTLKIEYSLCVIQSIGEKIISNKHSIYNTNLDYLIEYLEKFYEEFRIVKYSGIRLEENIKKSLDSHLQIMKDYESSIKSNINNLLAKKITQHNDKEIYNNFKPKFFIKNVKNTISDDQSNLVNQEIYFNNIIIGKIIQIQNKFDLFVQNITTHDQFINEFFDDYEECILFLNSLLA